MSLIDFMGISPDDMLDPSKVKVIDGIAGAGKSSGLHVWLTSAGIKYGRYTSTNALKRDAIIRYDMDGACETVAGGLFTTDNLSFYVEQKPPKFDTIVIDEVLQTNPKVMDWIASNRGSCNIFVTTDSKQMLAPGCGSILRKFEELCSDKNTVYTTTNKTLRALDSRTSDAYEELYFMDDNARDGFAKYRSQIPSISFDEMPIDVDSVYITHTRAIEDYLYRHCGFKEKGFRLIPKGRIANKPPADLLRYPCLSQIQADKRTFASYTQIANVATPTRYQGQEVHPNQKCYYIIEANSAVTNREFYTVITRCKSIDSMVIVIIDIPESEKLDYFAGKAVKTKRIASTTTEQIKARLGDDYPISDLIFDVDGTKCLDSQLIWNIRCVDKAPDGYYNIWEYAELDGKVYPSKEVAEVMSFSEDRPKVTPRGMLEKEDVMDISYMADVYRILDKHGISSIRYPVAPSSRDYRKVVQTGGIDFEIDMFCAYLQCFSKCRLPIDGDITTDRSKDLLGFWYYDGTELRHPCIVTDKLAFTLDPMHCHFLFSTPCIDGIDTARRWLADAHKSVESKAKYKNMRWGYLQKKYIEYDRDDDCYFINPNFCRELIMVAVLSEMVSVIMDAGKDLGVHYSVVDAVHCTDEDDARKAFERIVANGYDCRVRMWTNDGMVEVCSSFELKSAEERKREQARERKRKQRAAARA